MVLTKICRCRCGIPHPLFKMKSRWLAKINKLLQSGELETQKSTKINCLNLKLVVDFRESRPPD